MVTLRGVTLRRAGACVLGPLDLRLSAKGTTALMGPNGAGKTTLLRALHGLEPPSAGTLTWDAIETRDQAFVFQRPVMLRRTVRANLELPLTLRGLPHARAQAEAIAVDLDLTPLLDAPARALSGGETQKLAVARALITRPRALFLDEPTANLDAPTQRLLESVFARAAASGTRLFLATHSPAQARRLADDILWVADGRVTGPTPLATFFADPPVAAQSYLELLA